MLNPYIQDVPRRDLYKLDKIKRAAELLNHPELGRDCILVAGTNGKGSVVQMLSRWLQGTGLRVGSYYSPHVVDVGERIQINGRYISSLELSELEREYEGALESLTYFEKMTMLSFLHFRRRKVDLQIIEVGIGGRLDATNICDPSVSVISSISKDHEDVLGRGLSKIAYEKAGVMRAFAKCFVPNNLDLEAVDSLKVQASTKKAELVQVTVQDFEKIGQSLGKHQQQNASLAYAALNHFCSLRSLQTPTKVICEEIALTSQCPARIEILSRNPLWIVDGGHNVEAIGALTRRLQNDFSDHKFNLILGLMNDRSPDLLKPLLSFAKSVHFPSFYPERQHTARAMSQALGGRILIDLKAQLEDLSKQREPVLVAGSFYLAGEVLRLWRRGLR